MNYIKTQFKWNETFDSFEIFEKSTNAILVQTCSENEYLQDGYYSGVKLIL